MSETIGERAHQDIEQSDVWSGKNAKNIVTVMNGKTGFLARQARAGIKLIR
jgi:hypothetical protein